MTDFRNQAAAARANDNASPDDDDAAWEAREEYIEDNAPKAAKKLIGSPDFALSVLPHLSDDDMDAVLERLGTFMERYHALRPDDVTGAMEHARDLYSEVLPHIEAAALEQARTDVAEQYDRDQANTPRSHAEARQELAA